MVEWVNRRWGKHFQAANAVMSFAPADWRAFFKERGWELVHFENLAETATKINRIPAMMRVFQFIASAFPAWQAKQAKAFESGVALLRRA